MAINPLLLNVKPISEITTVNNPIEGHLLFYDGSDELKKVDIVEFQSLIGGIAKPLAITDASPTVSGWYKPTTSGTYANAGGLVAQVGYDTLFYFDGTTWSKVEVSMQEINTLQQITDNVLKNPDFKDARTHWHVNENFNANVVNGVLYMDTQGTTNPALFQVVPSLKAGNYIMSIKIKNKTNIKQSIKVGIVERPNTIDVNVGDTFNIFNVDINVNSDITNAVIMINPNPNVQLELDSCYLFKANNNFITNLIKPYYENIPFSFSKSITVTEAEDVNINVNSYCYVFDVAGGYRELNAGNLVVNFEEAVYLSATENIYTDVDMSKKGTGQTVYLIKERYDAYRTKLRNNLIGINYYGWSANHPSLKIEKTITSDYKKWFPNKSNIVSPLKSTLKPFIQKYYARTSDVTIVQIGDSISTDLNWTDKRPDANERPPFCTEYNVNSYLEEKLRWKEQKYRRFDYSGVFTETLGGGTSSVKETDDKWGAVGGAFYYPITKVIDGGTNAGISFGFPANNKRLSLILHSDQLFATETKVTISSGNGKVEVWNGSSWVEANNYTTSFQETSNPIVGEIEQFYMDNAQKRLKFRSLSDLSAKTITVQNVGAGRFGYWGIEYSPNDYMFTYICASKGSHSIARLQQYETWMVDEFNPDLVVWQMPILNEGLGVDDRGWASEFFGIKFKNKFETLNGKGYLVLPYILWAATYSEFVDTNGNFLSGIANGKIVSPFADVANIMSVFSSNDYPVINLFNLITEAAINKAKEENGNIYSSALIGSGKNGNTFTIDGIHMNKLGNEVVFNMLEPYFNF